MAENTACLRRWWARSATSPNQLGVEGMHWEDVWIVTAESVILFMSVSLLGTSFFFLIKETHSYACSLLVTSRCAIRGPIVVLLIVFRDFHRLLKRARAMNQHAFICVATMISFHKGIHQRAYGRTA